MFSKLRSLWDYLTQRLDEKSTWAGIGTAIAGGAALSAPYSWLAIGAGTIMVLIPDKKAGTPSEQSE